MEVELFPKMLPGKSRHVKKRVIIFACAVILILIVAFAAYFIITEQRKAAELAAKAAAEEEMRRQQALAETNYQALVKTNTFFDGLSIDGVDISGMTMDEARTALSANTAGYQPTGTLLAAYGEQSYPFDLSTVKVNLNTEDILASAFQVARRSTYAEASGELENLKVNGHNFTLTATYDFTAIASRVIEIAGLIDQPASDAAIKFTEDASAEKPYTITSEVTGVIVNQQLLMTEVTDAIRSGSRETIAIPVTEVVPTITSEYLANSYTLRASAETSFKGSDSNRISNIKKGAGLINGTVLKPGEVFSTNAVLGTRTEKNGWELAGAYVGGTVDKQAGGGVCQLSSTLYNAVVKADLEITYRRNHSMPVGYIKKGLDATINSVGNIIDFKFKNNTTADILIRAYTSGKALIFEVYGVPFATDAYDEIKLTSEQTKTVEPVGEIIETYDDTLDPGTTMVKVERQNGSVWQSYKNYYLKGTLVKSEKLAVSTYDAFAGEILVGPEIDLPDHADDPDEWMDDDYDNSSDFDEGIGFTEIN